MTKERLEHADMDDALLSEEETKLHRSLMDVTMTVQCNFSLEPC